ncbi:hypothetical protein LRE75_24660 [Streptomyces sp. 372A]
MGGAAGTGAAGGGAPGASSSPNLPVTCRICSYGLRSGQWCSPAASRAAGNGRSGTSGHPSRPGPLAHAVPS